MNISNSISTSSAQKQRSQTASSQKSNTMGKNGFLKLLVAQMKNQNPTNPMDGTKFATQLAQFNSVEQLINLNDGLSKLTQSQNNMSSGLTNTMAASLAGKKVRAISNLVHIKAGGKASIPFKLNNVASQAQITITDAAGNVIHTAKLQNLSSGDHKWTWNGRSDDGKDVPGGTYSVKINAQDGNSNVKTVTYQEGVANKVRYTQDGVKLMVNGIAVPLSDVEEISMNSQ